MPLKNPKQLKRVTITLIFLLLVFNVNYNVYATQIQGPFFTDEFYGVALKITIKTSSIYTSGHEKSFIIFMTPIILNSSILNVSVLSIIPYVRYSDITFVQIHEQKLISNTEFLRREITLPLNESESVPLVIRILIPNVQSYTVMELNLKVALKVISKDFEAAGFISIDNAGMIYVSPEPFLLRDKTVNYALMLSFFLLSLAGLVALVRKNGDESIKEAFILFLIILLVSLFVIQAIPPSSQSSYILDIQNIHFRKVQFKAALESIVSSNITIMVPTKTATPEWAPLIVSFSNSQINSNNVSAIQFIYQIQIHSNDTEDMLSNKTVSIFLTRTTLSLNYTFYNLVVRSSVIKVIFHSILMRAWLSNGTSIEKNISADVVKNIYFIQVTDSSGRYLNGIYISSTFLIVICIASVSYISLKIILTRKRYLGNSGVNSNFNMVKK